MKARKKILQSDSLFSKAVRNCDLPVHVIEEGLDDLDSLRKNGSSEKRKLANQISMSKKMRQAANIELRIDLFSSATIVTYSSEINFYCSICKNSGVQDFPATVRSLENFASILKASDYKSANCYLAAVMTTNSILGHGAMVSSNFSKTFVKSIVRK